ncbi:MAG: hypothetical protein ACMG6H_06500 [Acidobacteriota bacterium]
MRHLTETDDHQMGGEISTCSHSNASDLNGDADITRQEFHSLLNELRFVARVIDIHQKNHSRLIDIDSPNAPSGSLESDDEWQTLVTRNLPNWLFWITDILIMQAKLVARGCPMPRTQLAALLQDRFLRQASRDLLLKGSRNKFWTAHILRIAIDRALPGMRAPGAITLANLARRINADSQDVSDTAGKALSGKHLQKLLKKHDIDWIEIKRSHKKRLLTRMW